MTVETFEIRKRGPYEGGEQFGEGGAYERIDALVRFAVQPDHALNQGVTDLELAPRDAGGRVTFEADVVVLRPMDSARGNGRLLTSVVNRGRTALLPFSHPPAGMDMTLGERIQPGDAFLLRHGWTVLLCGWQWDVTRRAGLLGMDAPIATEEGIPASTRVTVQFQPLTNRPSEYLGHWPSHPTFHEERVHTAYPAADVTDSEAVLTVREHQASPPTTVARDEYRFARVAVDGSETTEATWVTMEGGFVAGLVYELTYRTNRCPVAGTGLLAIRDAASFLRFGASEVDPCAG